MDNHVAGELAAAMHEGSLEGKKHRGDSAGKHATQRLNIRFVGQLTIEKGKPMTRSSQEVFTDHLRALATRDIGTLAKDYSADAVILTQQGALEGTAGAEQFYGQAFEVLPDVEFAVKWTVFGGNSLLAAWTATASAGHVDDGLDTMSFTAGTICLHASSFTITPNETANSPG